MIETLNLRYPFFYIREDLLKQSIQILVIVFMFLWLLRPVGVDSGISVEFSFLCFAYSMIASISFLMLYGGMPNFFPSFFNKSRWTVAKEILGFLSLMLCIGLLNFVLRQYVSTGTSQFSFPVLFEELIHAQIVGIVPLTFMSVLNFIRKHRALFLNQGDLVKDECTTERVIINSATTNDSINIDPNDLCYAKADGNYVELIMISDGAIMKKILRITLSEVERAFCKVPFLLRTHRTYLVNLRKVKSYEGNAQGYQLELNGCIEKIPVSRNKANVFVNRV